jgi:hypothetical protein
LADWLDVPTTIWLVIAARVRATAVQGKCLRTAPTEGMTSLAGSDETSVSVGEYEVAVAIVSAESPRRPSSPAQETATLGPGFDETAGRHAAARSTHLAKGDTAVKLATEAIARQIGLAAQRIATAIDTQAISSPVSGVLDLESVEVSFGVTLSAGIEAMFTAKSESSAEVTIILSRRSRQ